MTFLIFPDSLFPMKSTLQTCRQSRIFRKQIDNNTVIIVTVRHDDTCRNGHNTFSVTGDIYKKSRWAGGGCPHEEIAKHFPELTPLIKWHLCSTDGPLHYVENSFYWAGKTKWTKANLANFRSAAIWPEATENDMENVSEIGLATRLPELMKEFQTTVKKLGFVY